MNSRNAPLSHSLRDWSGRKGHGDPSWLEADHEMMAVWSGRFDNEAWENLCASRVLRERRRRACPVRLGEGVQGRGRLVVGSPLTLLFHAL